MQQSALPISFLSQITVKPQTRAKAKDKGVQDAASVETCSLEKAPSAPKPAARLGDVLELVEHKKPATKAAKRSATAYRALRDGKALSPDEAERLKLEEEDAKGVAMDEAHCRTISGEIMKSVSSLFEILRQTQLDTEAEEPDYKPSERLRDVAAELSSRVLIGTPLLRVGVLEGVAEPTEEEEERPDFDETKVYECAVNADFNPQAYESWAIEAVEEALPFCSNEFLQACLKSNARDVLKHAPLLAAEMGLHADFESLSDAAQLYILKKLKHLAAYAMSFKVSRAQTPGVRRLKNYLMKLVLEAARESQPGGGKHGKAAAVAAAAATATSSFGSVVFSAPHDSVATTAESAVVSGADVGPASTAEDSKEAAAEGSKAAESSKSADAKAAHADAGEKFKDEVGDLDLSHLNPMAVVSKIVSNHEKINAMMTSLTDGERNSLIEAFGDGDITNILEAIIPGCTAQMTSAVGEGAEGGADSSLMGMFQQMRSLFRGTSRGEGGGADEEAEGPAPSETLSIFGELSRMYLSYAEKPAE